MTAAGCESVRGEWGGICPDCGRRLPPVPRPMTSWQAAREINAVLSDAATKMVRSQSNQSTLDNGRLA